MKVIQPRNFHGLKFIWVLAVLLAFALFTWRRDAPAESDPAWTGQTMGTTYSIRLAGVRLRARELAMVQKDVQAVLDEVNRQMSHYQPDSELSRFNRAGADQPFPVSAGFARVVRFALELHRRSGGVFDPTLGPLIDLWGFGPPGLVTKPPDEAPLQDVRSQCGASHLFLPEDGALRKNLPGLHLNLSAVAKGYGVDEAARYLRERGFSNVFVEVGGEVTTFGVNSSGQKWRVGVDAPRPESRPGEDIEAVLHLSGQAVATSGDYRTFFVDDKGRRFSHILDPRTGRPILHTLTSVSVVASNCLEADGLATTLMVLGTEEGLRWLADWPGAEALFIDRLPDGRFQLRATMGFAAATGFAPPSAPVP